MSELEITGWLARIRAEYREMPGLRLTESQMRRLWSLDAATAARVLRTLLGERFLVRTAEGKYVRADSGLRKSFSQPAWLSA